MNPLKVQIKEIFLELTEFVANHDAVFMKKNAASNAKYIYSSIQNKLLQIQSARDEIAEAKFYSVLPDATKDWSKNEQFLVYIHCYNYVLNLAVVDCCKDISEFL